MTAPSSFWQAQEKHRGNDYRELASSDRFMLYAARVLQSDSAATLTRRPAIANNLR